MDASNNIHPTRRVSDRKSKPSMEALVDHHKRIYWGGPSTPVGSASRHHEQPQHPVSPSAIQISLSSLDGSDRPNEHNSLAQIREAEIKRQERKNGAPKKDAAGVQLRSTSSLPAHVEDLHCPCPIPLHPHQQNQKQLERYAEFNQPVSLPTLNMRSESLSFWLDVLTPTSIQLTSTTPTPGNTQPTTE
ncbi:hypothetical protein SprV_0602206000 [Sparganum proliferum]